MTFMPGMGPRLSEALGFAAEGPYALCNGCGATCDAVTKRGDYKAWFRNGKAPPGWFHNATCDSNSIDYCKACKVKHCRD